MDALTLLKQDHRAVSKVFDDYKKAGGRAHKTKERLVRQMITELSKHAYVEEHVFYPAVRQRVPDAADEVLESIEEHHIVKWLLSELDGLAPTEESFDPKVRVLIENVEHHVEEEEKQMFPAVAKAMSKDDLADLGGRMELAKKKAPSEPELARAS